MGTNKKIAGDLKQLVIPLVSTHKTLGPFKVFFSLLYLLNKTALTADSITLYLINFVFYNLGYLK